MSKKYKILTTKPATGNKEGSITKIYQKDKIINAEDQWQKEIMDVFVNNSWAMEVKMDSVEDTLNLESSVKPKRARNTKGQLKADDPSTPNINEAWEDGKAPVKTTTKKTTKKKS